jgi:hypothetical protein
VTGSSGACSSTAPYTKHRLPSLRTRPFVPDNLLFFL